MKKLFSLSILALLGVVMLASIAAMPAQLTAPNTPTVTSTANAGELQINFDPVPGAQFYTIGYANLDELYEMVDSGRHALDAYYYVTIEAAHTSHTLTGLKPSTGYYVRVGAQTQRTGGAGPVYSGLAPEATTAGQHGAGFCPITGLPLPPTGYLSITDTTVHALGSTFKLNSTTPKTTIRLGDRRFQPFEGRQFFQICGSVQASPNSQKYFLAGYDYTIDTDAGSGFAFFDEDTPSWSDVTPIPPGESRNACQTWDIPDNTNTVIIALNNWRASPALYKVDLP